MALMRSSRSPHGERGLKSCYHLSPLYCSRRAPPGERGLKYLAALSTFATMRGRSPHGERGLKWGMCIDYYQKKTVAPRTGSVG